MRVGSNPREVIRVLTLLAPLVLGAAPACADDALDPVRVCGDLIVPGDLVAVRVTVLDEALAERGGGVVELDGASPRQLPVEVAVPHHVGRRVVRAQAIGEGGVEVARADVLADGAAGERVTLNLVADCLGQLCPLGQTCLAGACTVTPEAGDPRLRCDTPEATP